MFTSGEISREVGRGVSQFAPCTIRPMYNSPANWVHRASSGTSVHTVDYIGAGANMEVTWVHRASSGTSVHTVDYKCAGATMEANDSQGSCASPQVNCGP